MNETTMPLIAALRTSITEKRVYITPRLSVGKTTEAVGPISRGPDHFIFRSRAIFEMQQIADGREPPEVIPMLHKQASRALAKEVYGPVRERLHEILIMLWEAGPTYDDKVHKAVNELFESLNP
jgi:hypothetical protein